MRRHSRAPRGGVTRNPAAGVVLPQRSNHPAVDCVRGFPSLSKEGNFSAEFRYGTPTPALKP